MNRQLTHANSVAAMLLWTLVILSLDFTIAFQKVNPQLRNEILPKGRLAKALDMLPHYECTTAAVMSGLGDVLAQLQQHKKDPSIKPKVNWKRTYKFMMKGFGEGFLWTLWYRNAERWSLAITSFLTGNITNPFLTTLIGTFVALFLDLTLACPFIYGLWDIPFPALLRGKPLRKIPGEVKEKLGEMLSASIRVWTPVNILIYNVPVQYRVYIMSIADVFWQSIVSSITSSNNAEPTTTCEPVIDGVQTAQPVQS